MEPASENSVLFRRDLIDQTVFPGDASGPATGKFVFQRLRLFQARKRISLNLSDKANNADNA
jgi:hypothetical protein